jgi:Cu+-exporting ATPase
METLIAEDIKCQHCGDTCPDTHIQLDTDKFFCCEGCKTVYEILSQNGMCSYYDLDKNLGISLKGKNFGTQYAFLNNPEIAKPLLDYSSENICKITLHIPAIHCSSCIWLLENLYKLREGITMSRVNFMRKELALSFDPTIISLQQLVELLATLGYAPQISLEEYSHKAHRKANNGIFLKIGIVGFCTGNVMLLSFPEYFGLDYVMEGDFKRYFTWLNVLLTLPVIFYGASGYFVSAYKSLKEKVINLDVPISIGVLALFIRSSYETFTGTGPGYWDSLCGLVFFLLIGKWLQHKTYENLSFERNYKSYFPLAAAVVKDGKEESIPVSQLQLGDKILIRNQELIPADSLLLSGQAWIDYSFVTGESQPVEKRAGEYIYAGGRQIGTQIELTVQKPVSQSYLTQLWNNETFAKEKITPVTKLASTFSKYFTYITISIALLAATFWYFTDQSVIWNAFTAVLIVACPCALTLSMPFTMENTMRIFGKNGFYVKNPGVIQHLATITHIVFDKTGTLTHDKKASITYVGDPLTTEEKQLIKSIAAQSTHPLSRKISSYLGKISSASINNYHETTGAGIEGIVLDTYVRLGSGKFVGMKENPSTSKATSRVYVFINYTCKGYFELQNQYRTGFSDVLNKLRSKFKLSLLSGDHVVDLPVLLPVFEKRENMYFEQSPADKLQYIQKMQTQGDHVLMIGDGLNDAGALKQSDVGMVLTEDVHAFFPACDVLVDARNFDRLDKFIRFSQTSINIVKASFLLSLVYNFIGVGLAASGQLSPVFAALFMPLSSMSVVAFAVGMSSLFAQWRKL